MSKNDVAKQGVCVRSQSNTVCATCAYFVADVYGCCAV